MLNLMALLFRLGIMASLVQVGVPPWQLRNCRTTRVDVGGTNHDMSMQHVNSRPKGSESMRHEKEHFDTWYEKGSRYVNTVVSKPLIRIGKNPQGTITG